jgi:hypothetical protein
MTLLGFLPFLQKASGADGGYSRRVSCFLVIKTSGEPEFHKRGLHDPSFFV